MKTMEETPQKKKRVASFFLDILRGVSLGISAAVAGLSAGTVAVAERCYDTLIGAVADLRKKFKSSFLTLLPYALGLILGAIAALIGIQRGYHAAPFTLTGLFAGFVAGSLPVAISELRKGNNAKEKWVHAIAFLLCFALAALLGIITALTDFRLTIFDSEGHLSWYVYLMMLLAGYLGAFACVVPGISGSMSLMVIGMYYPILNTYTGKEAIWHSGNQTTIVLGLLLAGILVIGAILGIITGSKIMKYFLSQRRVSTFYGILGLVLGSLVSMFMNSSIYPLYPTIAVWDYILGAILFVLAGVGMFFLVFYAGKKEKEASVSDASKPQ